MPDDRQLADFRVRATVMVKMRAADHVEAERMARQSLPPTVEAIHVYEDQELTPGRLSADMDVPLDADRARDIARKIGEQMAAEAVGVGERVREASGWRRVSSIMADGTTCGCGEPADDEPGHDPDDEPIRIPYRPTSEQLWQAAMSIGPGERIVVERGRPENETTADDWQGTVVGFGPDYIDSDGAAHSTLKIAPDADPPPSRPPYWQTIRETAERLMGHPVEDRVVRAVVGWLVCGGAIQQGLIGLDMVKGRLLTYYVAEALANYNAAPLLSERLADEMGVES